MSQSPRAQRIAHGIRDVVAQMIDREVKDPRVHGAGFVGVNHVELNRDGSVATIYVSFYGEATPAGVDGAMAGLGASAGFLRGHVARRLKLKRAPELRFIRDDSPDFNQRLSDIIAADRGEGSGDVG